MKSRIAVIMVLSTVATLFPWTGLSAPPVKCQFELGAWCIAENSLTIATSRLSDGSGRIWLFRDTQKSLGELIVSSPYGCEFVKSDVLRLVQSDARTIFSGKVREKRVIRLTKDGSCDLSVYGPTALEEAGERSLTTWLTFLRQCSKENCPGASLWEAYKLAR